MKICLDCAQPLAFRAFALDRSRKDGFYPYCRACLKRQHAARKLGLRLRVLIPLTPQMSATVQALRIRRNWRQADLAAELGYHERHISRVERGCHRRVTKEFWETILELERRVA